MAVDLATYTYTAFDLLSLIPDIWIMTNNCWKQYTVKIRIGCYTSIYRMVCVVCDGMQSHQKYTFQMFPLIAMRCRYSSRIIFPDSPYLNINTVNFIL